jgi:hypothetical protein
MSHQIQTASCFAQSLVSAVSVNAKIQVPAGWFTAISIVRPIQSYFSILSYGTVIGLSKNLQPTCHYQIWSRSPQALCFFCQHCQQQGAAWTTNDDKHRQHWGSVFHYSSRRSICFRSQCLFLYYTQYLQRDTCRSQIQEQQAQHFDSEFFHLCDFFSINWIYLHRTMNLPLLPKSFQTTWHTLWALPQI